jgi:hypothetical protein
VSRPPESAPLGSGAGRRSCGALGDAPQPRVVPGRRASVAGAAALARVSGSASASIAAKFNAAMLSGRGLALSRRGASAASLVQLAEEDETAAPSPPAATLSAKARWQLAVGT